MMTTNKLTGYEGIDFTGYKILISDEESYCRLLYHIVFERSGAHVFEAGTAEDILKHLDENNDIDIVFLDADLSDMNVYQLISHIKSGNERILVAVHTAQFKLNKLRCYDAGCEIYIEKPFFCQPVMDRIQKHWQKTRISAEKNYEGFEIK